MDVTDLGQPAALKLPKASDLLRFPGLFAFPSYYFVQRKYVGKLALR